MAEVNNLVVKGEASFSNTTSFNGTVTAPTATAGTSNTQVATTKFVMDAIAAAFNNRNGIVYTTGSSS